MKVVDLFWKLLAVRILDKWYMSDWLQNCYAEDKSVSFSYRAVHASLLIIII